MTDDAFDALMQANDAAVVVVAASGGTEVDACLVGFHSQCSIEPLRYAVWLSTSNRTYRLACAADAVTVHWLAEGGRALAEAVGGDSLDDDPAKMAHLRWHRDDRGLVRLDDAIGGFTGRIVRRDDVGGDHACFVLEPLEAWAGPATSVLRFRAVDDIRAGHPPAG